MPENKTLIIWLNDGNTCKFEQVENLRVFDSVIKFDYFGVSTQVKREAVFYTKNIAGHAFEF